MTHNKYCLTGEGRDQGLWFWRPLNRTSAPAQGLTHCLSVRGLARGPGSVLDRALASHVRTVCWSRDVRSVSRAVPPTKPARPMTHRNHRKKPDTFRDIGARSGNYLASAAGCGVHNIRWFTIFDAQAEGQISVPTGPGKCTLFDPPKAKALCGESIHIPTPRCNKTRPVWGGNISTWCNAR